MMNIPNNNITPPPTGENWKVFQKTLIVLGTLVGAYLFYQIGQIILVVFIAIIFASAIRPLVEALERLKINKVLAILLVYIVVLFGLGGLIVVTVPSLIGLFNDLSDTSFLVERLRSMLRWLTRFSLEEFNVWLPHLTFTLPQQLQVFLAQAETTAQEQAWPLAQSTFLVLSQIGLALVMSFYWLTSREQALSLLLRLRPIADRWKVKVIWDDVETTLGGYIRGQIILATIVGTGSLAGLLLFRVPHAIGLAVFAALMEMIPFIGPFAGAVPAIIVGFMVSPATGILIAAWYLVLQQIEGNILVPKVHEKNVGLNPLLVIVALIAGFTLNGVVGAIIAVPLAGAGQVIAQHLLITPTIQNHISAIVTATGDTPVQEPEGKPMGGNAPP